MDLGSWPQIPDFDPLLDPFGGPYSEGSWSQEATFRGLGDPGIGTPKGPKMGYSGPSQHGDSAAVTLNPGSRTWIWGSRPPKWGYLDMAGGRLANKHHDSGVQTPGFGVPDP